MRGGTSGCSTNSWRPGTSRLLSVRLPAAQGHQPDYCLCLNHVTLRTMTLEYRYLVPRAGEALIDQEFDRLDHLLRELQFSEVSRTCAGLIQQHPITSACGAWARLLLAEVALRQGNYEEAGIGFADLVAAAPTYKLRAQTGQGFVALRQGKLDLSETCFQDVIRHDASADRALVGLGQVAAARGQSQQAWDFFLTAFTVDVLNTEALAGLVAQGFKLGLFVELEAALRRYLSEDALRLNFRCCLASCLAGQGRLLSAFDEINKVLSFDPTHSEALELKQALESLRTQAMV